MKRLFLIILFLGVPLYGYAQENANTKVGLSASYIYSLGVPDNDTIDTRVDLKIVSEELIDNDALNARNFVDNDTIYDSILPVADVSTATQINNGGKEIKFENSDGLLIDWGSGSAWHLVYGDALVTNSTLDNDTVVRDDDIAGFVDNDGVDARVTTLKSNGTIPDNDTIDDRIDNAVTTGVIPDNDTIDARFTANEATKDQYYMFTIPNPVDYDNETVYCVGPLPNNIHITTIKLQASEDITSTVVFKWIAANGTATTLNSFSFGGEKTKDDSSLTDDTGSSGYTIGVEPDNETYDFLGCCITYHLNN